MFKEYNIDLNTNTIISVSMQKENFINIDNKKILYNKREYGTGRFLERYIVLDEKENLFASVDKDWNIEHVYKTYFGNFDYGSNQLIVRDDGRKYFGQFDTLNIELLPHSDKIKEIVKNYDNINGIIYVEKESGPQIYLILKMKRLNMENYTDEIKKYLRNRKKKAGPQISPQTKY